MDADRAFRPKLSRWHPATLSVRAQIRAQLAGLERERFNAFDAHAHTGADVDGSLRTAADHLEELDAFAGKSVVFPFCVEGGYAAENQRVIAEASASGGRLVAFARLDPKAGDVAAEAMRALEAGARGFKLHPRAEAFRLDHPGVAILFHVAAAARVPILIHAGLGVGSFGASLAALVAGHRECPVILAHAGVSDLAWLGEIVDDHPNVFFDTAWLVPADIQALFASVPPGRILYGSDAPYMDIELVQLVTLRLARAAGLDDDALRLVMGRQLEILLSGEPAADVGGAVEVAEPSPRSPGEQRLLAYLNAAGGCLFGGGDPALPLELAALALAEARTGPAAGGDQALTELLEEAAAKTDESLSAMILATAMALTPAVDAVTPAPVPVSAR